jgi:carbon monoxide dehydrogenase subunit G
VEFDNSFEVPLPPAEAWVVLTDIRRVAPCMPGAELTDVVDERTYRGKIAVRLGPVALVFAGIVQFEEMDAVHRRARVKAQGSDAKGRGGAHAAASFRLEPAREGTKVLVHTELSLSGSVAQYGRGAGMIQATAGQIMAQFAANLKAQLGERGAASTTDAPASAAATSDARMSASLPVQPPAGAKPISGFSLMAKVLWEAIVRLFTGRSRTS